MAKVAFVMKMVKYFDVKLAMDAYGKILLMCTHTRLEFI